MSAWRLKPSVQCQTLRFVCGYYAEFRTWREAKTAAIAHVRETEHSVRVERLTTLLIEPKSWSAGEVKS